MAGNSAAAYARSAVETVRDDPAARFSLMRRLYEVPRDVDRGYLPYRRAATAFMNWQMRRGLLNPPGWYHAHNASIAAGYLDNEPLAADEGRVERFFINVVPVRVLFAHALVSAPRLALGWLAPVGRVAGDPRIGMTGIFLSLSRVLPDEYPLGDDVETYVAIEHGFGHVLDIGIIAPRVRPPLPMVVGSACAARPRTPGGRQYSDLCVGFGTRRRRLGLQAVATRAACPAARSGPLVTFARKREATVAGLLDQPVDEQ